MSFSDEGPFGKLAVQRAQANIVLERLAACVFAISGAAAAFSGRLVLAAGFAMAAGILFCISVFASIRLRGNLPGPRP